MERLRIGTSGWVYRDWRGRFYPEKLAGKRWLAYYAERFDCVELNGSFYRLPTHDAFRKWAATVPDTFRFAVKGSQFVTHWKRLMNSETSVALLMDRVHLLGERLGPVLWQLRPDHRVDVPRLRAFFDVLPDQIAGETGPVAVRYAFEPRHPSWYCDEVYALCEERGVAVVLWHMLEEETPIVATAPFVYVRFHGTTRKYGGAYGEAGLRIWAERARMWLDEGREVWAFFNNDIEGHAVADAATLRGLLGA